MSTPVVTVSHPQVYASDYAASMAARTLLLRAVNAASDTELCTGMPITAVVRINIPGSEETERRISIGGAPRTDISREALTTEINLAAGFEADFLL